MKRGETCKSLSQAIFASPKYRLLSADTRLFLLMAHIGNWVGPSGIGQATLDEMAYDAHVNADVVRGELDRIPAEWLYCLDGWLYIRGYAHRNNASGKWGVCVRVHYRQHYGLLPLNMQRYLDQDESLQEMINGGESGTEKTCTSTEIKRTGTENSCTGTGKKRTGTTDPDPDPNPEPVTGSSSSSSSVIPLSLCRTDDDDDDGVNRSVSGNRREESGQDEEKPRGTLKGQPAPLWTDERPECVSESEWRVYCCWATLLYKKPINRNALTDTGLLAIRTVLALWSEFGAQKLIQAKAVENKAKAGKRGWEVRDSLEQLFERGEVERASENVRGAVTQEIHNQVLSEVLKAVGAGTMPAAWSRSWIQRCIDDAGGWEALKAPKAQRAFSGLAKAQIEKGK
jgi:hypothetical protein